jgi:hypothetical protein
MLAISSLESSSSRTASSFKISLRRNISSNSKSSSTLVSSHSLLWSSLIRILVIPLNAASLDRSCSRVDGGACGEEEVALVFLTF